MPHVVSVQVGRVQSIGTHGSEDPWERPWTTAFFKLPVEGPVGIQSHGCDGDESCDRRFHGGLDKAVLAYAADHYPLWQAELGEPEMGPGGFGENLTITGVSEASVCIGDSWQIGSALLQVSQPRQPCWKLGRRWRRRELPKIVIRHSRTGWYLRVLQPGMVQAGDEATLVERPHADWPVARANSVYYLKGEDPARRELAALAELSETWTEELLGVSL